MKLPDKPDIDVDVDAESVKKRLADTKDWLVRSAKRVRSASEDVTLPLSRTQLAVGLSVLLGVLVLAAVVVFAPFLWTVAVFATIVGFVPGLLLFPWVTSPFGPGLLMLDEPFARIHFTISQFIRRAGVVVKRASNDYEFGTYLPESNEVLLSDTRVPLDTEQLSWGLFGKRKFGVTWELGTDLHRRIMPSGEEVATDGGGERTVNVAAAHRYFRGSNDADVISRTEEAAEAEYGGGEELSTPMMGLLVGLMLFLGSMTTFLML